MADKKLTVKSLPLLPLRELLVFPHTVVPLFVGREKSIRALDDAMGRNREIFLAAQRKSKSQDPLPEDIYEFGTVAQILQLLRLPDGTVKILVEGKRRARVMRYHEGTDWLVVDVQEIEEPKGHNVENVALVRSVRQAFDAYVKLNKKVPPEMVFSVANIEDESRLADTLVVQLQNLKVVDKQKILEIVEPSKRLEEIFSILQSEIEILRVEKKIRARVKKQMEKTQKEYYLNEQMNAIQKELGNVDDVRSEIAEIESRLKVKKMPDEPREKIKKELKKLRGMSPMSAESTVVRNYVDTLMSLPWNEITNVIRDPLFAEKVLDEDHHGLEKVKERVLEFLAINSLSETLKGPILCLVGPPGVGKTSLARSVARATGRQFARIALGGVRDEAEIRGHRRTYIGSMPGKIINAIKKAGASNPVLLLDEIDKMNSDFRGDPASAMLEVLDPEQNHTFVDHYLDLDYDLSQVMFIATANNIHSIPRPLLDRCEVIQLGSYTDVEKISIAQKHLVPKAAKANGLDPSHLDFQEEALREIVNHYTREAGVRNLEREISSVCRKVAREMVKTHFPQVEATPEGKKSTEVLSLAGFQAPPINGELVRKLLGARKYTLSEKNLHDRVGVCQGLAWTEVGGDMLEAQALILPGKGNIKVTGKLGEVMQESAALAFSYVRSRSAFLGLEDDFYSKIDVHIHFPDGATPKDGPSAGVTMVTALVSALTKKPVSRDIAMTGEINLVGSVMMIGGLKEKILAAHRGGVKKVIIPRENEKDLAEVPRSVLESITIIPADHMDLVLLHAILWGENDVLEARLKDNLAMVSLAGLNIGHGHPTPGLHH